MELIEKVNYDICKKINYLSLIQFAELLNMSKSKRYNDYDLKKEFSKLKNFTKTVIFSKNNNKIKYEFVETKDFGRLQSKDPSLQRIFNGFRGILSNNLTYDLDMKNCHPTIILNLCKKHNINCPNLKNYINNREKMLDELMIEHKLTKAEAKIYFLKCMNKEELTTLINNKVIKNKNFKSYDQETSEIINLLFEIYKKDFIKYVKNETYNQKGKLVNLVLCKIENEYLHMAIEYIKSKNIEISTLMYDGLMIYKNNKYDIIKIIEGLNKLFDKEKIEWVVKEHNIDLLEPLNNMEIKEVETYIGNDIIEVVNYILENSLKNRIFKCDNDTYFISDDKIISNIKSIEKELYSYISEQDFNIFVDGKIKNLSKIHSQIDNLVESIINKAPRDNKFINNVYNYTNFKLFFNNGYYDFKNKEFIEGIYNKTFIKINRNYNPIKNKKIRNQIFENILFPVFSIDNLDEDNEQYKLLNYYLYRIARIIAGHVEDKIWVLMQGLRNSGKGVLSDLLQNSLESYVKTTNSGNFKYKKTNVDEAKSLSWLVNCRFCRLIISQEIDISEKIN